MPSSWNNAAEKQPERNRLLRLEILEVYCRADGPEPAIKQTLWMGCALYDGYGVYKDWNERRTFFIRSDMEVKWKYWED